MTFLALYAVVVIFVAATFEIHLTDEDRKIPGLTSTLVACSILWPLLPVIIKLMKKSLEKKEDKS